MSASPRQPRANKNIVRPYGDATGDGMVQMSFTLPLAHDKRAEGAAQLFATKMGMDPAMVVHAKAMGPDFTFFVVYGPVHHLVDVRDVVVVERDYPRADRLYRLVLERTVSQFCSACQWDPCRSSSALAWYLLTISSTSCHEGPIFLRISGAAPEAAGPSVTPVQLRRDFVPCLNSRV